MVDGDYTGKSSTGVAFRIYVIDVPEADRGIPGAYKGCMGVFVSRRLVLEKIMQLCERSFAYD